MRRIFLAVLLALGALVACPGCDAFAWILVKTIGPWVPEDEVPAQFSLQGKSVVVLVDTKEPGLASEFPRLEPSLADAIGKVLADHKACGPIVPARSVEVARRTQPEFGQWSAAEVGKFFNVDLVMHVEVFQFRLKEQASSSVFQGYAETAVHLVSPETGQQVWPVLSAARIITAETTPDVEAESPVQQETILTDGLGDKIARQFFTFKKNELPMRPKVK